MLNFHLRPAGKGLAAEADGKRLSRDQGPQREDYKAEMKTQAIYSYIHASVSQGSVHLSWVFLDVLRVIFHQYPILITCFKNRGFS